MNENTLSFCPHCGEDLRALISPEEKPAAPARRRVVSREVLRQEIEALWGLMPLPFGTRPMGGIVEGESDVPVAIACESQDGKLWECKMGQQVLLDLSAPTTSPTVTNHVCINATSDQREATGKEKYGRR